jgi:hypothetical protein
MRSKLEIIDSFGIFIEEKLNINIEKLKYKSKVLKFFKYDWDKILGVFKSNKNLFNTDDTELENILTKIKEKYLELIHKYKSLMDIWTNLKINLDKIIEYLYLN